MPKSKCYENITDQHYMRANISCHGDKGQVTLWFDTWEAECEGEITLQEGARIFIEQLLFEGMTLDQKCEFIASELTSFLAIVDQALANPRSKAAKAALKNALEHLKVKYKT